MRPSSPSCFRGGGGRAPAPPGGGGLHAFGEGALAGVEQRSDRFSVVEAREEIGELGRMARSPFIGAVLARGTRPGPVAELVGVDRRVFRKVPCQLQIGAAADAGILA